MGWFPFGIFSLFKVILAGGEYFANIALNVEILGIDYNQRG